MKKEPSQKKSENPILLFVILNLLIIVIALSGTNILGDFINAQLYDVGDLPNDLQRHDYYFHPQKMRIHLVVRVTSLVLIWLVTGWFTLTQKHKLKAILMTVMVFHSLFWTIYYFFFQFASPGIIS